MAYTESSMLPLGSSPAEFNLPDAITGKSLTMNDFNGYEAYLIMFICNHCPYVKHIMPELRRLQDKYVAKIAMIAINSNDIEKYPDDRPELMKEFFEEHGLEFPYLFDETQEIAKAFKAECTPDFYLFNNQKKLVYRGRLDKSRPKNEEPLNGEDLRKAIEAVLGGQPVDEKQYPSGGCNIKWKN